MLAVFALPFRVPISTGGRTVNLLVPLYLVVAAGILAASCPALPRPAASGRSWAPPAPPRTGLLGHPVGDDVAAGRHGRALRAADDLLQRRGQGGREPSSSTSPSALLFVLLSMVRWDASCCCAAWRSRSPRRSCSPASASSSTHRKSLFLNPKVVAANQFDNYFRVNSVFFDPSIYGRFLALVMIAVMHGGPVDRRPPRRDRGRVRARVAAGRARDELLAVEHRRPAARPGGARRVALGVRATLLTSAGVLAARAGGAAWLAPESLHFGLKGSSGSTSNATSGRTTLIEGGLKLFAKRPLRGLRLGLLRNASTRRSPDTTNQNAVLGVAHDPRDDRRRAGHRRAGAVRGAPASAPSRCCSAAPGARPRGSRSRPASPPWCCTPGRTPTSSRTRSPGPCWRSARRSPRLGPAGGGVAEPLDAQAVGP